MIENQHCSLKTFLPNIQHLITLNVIFDKVSLFFFCKINIENCCTNLWNWQSLFLLNPSQMLTNPSEPPVANVLCVLWNAIEFTGNIFSTPFSLILWHLKAYFRFWTSGLGSRYSTATRPWSKCRVKMLKSLCFLGFF